MVDKPSGELKTLLRLSFAFTAFAAWLAFIWILTGQSELGSAILFGYSAQRLVLAALALFPALLLSWLSWQMWRKPKSLEFLYSSSKAFLRPNIKFWITLALTLGVAFFSWVFFFLPLERAAQFFGSYALYLPRIRPLLFFGISLGVVSSGLLVFLRFGFEVKALRGQSRTLRLALFMLVGLLIIWLLLMATGLGLGFDATIWNAPGTPILSSQVFLALVLTTLALAVFFILLKRFPSSFFFKRADILLAGLIWVLAAVLWLRQPAQPTYYSSPPRPPNFVSYPISDAFNHDVIANNVLVGEGFHFGGLVAIRRPLYVLFLAGIEALLGPDYDLVVSAQVIVLAFFPALLYLLGSKLHSRFSGLLLAGLVVFRETNSIALGHVINASHAKLLMADLPTALGMAAIGLAAVVWLRGSPRNYLAGLLTGGLLGAFILLRSQTLTLIPFIVLLALFVWGWRIAWKQGLVFIIGVLLVSSPWIIRNRVGMGQWAIEDSVVSGFLANRYRLEPGTFGLPFLSGETEGEYYARQMASVKEFAIQSPLYVAGFVADNFVRNELLNFMAMPVSFQLRDLESHVRELPYWPSWDGNIPLESTLPILANLFFVSLGLVVAWRQARWVGMVPVFMNIGFTFNLALARVSGWRYNLPIDWTVLLYYALGIGQLVVWCLVLLRSNAAFKSHLANMAYQSKDRKREHPLPSKAQWVASIALFLLVGNSFLIIEGLSRPRYQKLSPQEAGVILSSSVSQDTQKAQLEALMARGQLDILNGRALYPVFYRAGEGVAGSESDLNMPLDFKRLTFYLIGPEAASVILRVNTQQLDVPTSSDVVVFRCGSNAGEAAAVIVRHSEGDQLIITSDLAQVCPGLGS